MIVVYFLAAQVVMALFFIHCWLSVKGQMKKWEFYLNVDFRRMDRENWRIRWSHREMF